MSLNFGVRPIRNSDKPIEMTLPKMDSASLKGLMEAFPGVDEQTMKELFLECRCDVNQLSERLASGAGVYKSKKATRTTERPKKPYVWKERVVKQEKQSEKPVIRRAKAQPVFGQSSGATWGTLDLNATTPTEQTFEKVVKETPKPTEVETVKVVEEPKPEPATAAPESGEAKKSMEEAKKEDANAKRRSRREAKKEERKAMEEAKKEEKKAMEEAKKEEDKAMEEAKKEDAIAKRKARKEAKKEERKAMEEPKKEEKPEPKKEEKKNAKFTTVFMVKSVEDISCDTSLFGTFAGPVVKPVEPEVEDAEHLSDVSVEADIVIPEPKNKIEISPECVFEIPEVPPPAPEPIPEPEPVKEEPKMMDPRQPEYAQVPYPPHGYPPQYMYPPFYPIYPEMGPPMPGYAPMPPYVRPGPMPEDARRPPQMIQQPPPGFPQAVYSQSVRSQAPLGEFYKVINQPVGAPMQYQQRGPAGQYP